MAVPQRLESPRLGEEQHRKLEPPAKEVADERVGRALYHRAIGYSHPAVKVLTVALGNNAGSKVVREEYTEHYPPDTAAICF